MSVDPLKYLSGSLCLMILLMSGCQSTDPNTNTQDNTINPPPPAAVRQAKPKTIPRIVSKVNTISEDPIDDADTIYEGNENIPEGVYIYESSIRLNRKASQC